MASDFAIRFAAHQLRQGSVIAYPTETVYGLGCDPMNAGAVSDLCKLKNRDPDKGLILLSSNLELFDNYIETLDDSARRKITQTGPPTSWIVPARKTTPAWLTGNRDTLVIRVTQHPVVSKLCHRLQHPLVSSSANPGGCKPALNALQVHRYFHHKLDAILVSADTCSGKPSLIRQLETDELIRR